MTSPFHRRFLFGSLPLFGLLAALAATSFAPSASVKAASEPEDPWPELRAALFDDHEILDGAGVISLDAPYRAADAAIVPVTMTAEIPQTPERYIKAITLVIDQNPAPVAAVFNMTPESGVATIATRVRINAYSNVRAIAETNDGRLYMAARFVKASGGCSAPALKDQDQALARLGRMKLKQSPRVVMGEPNQVQLLISHPNYSGLQMNQLTRHYIPAHFVREIKVRYGETPILEVEGAISLSEDPSIHFSFVPREPALLSVEVEDTDDQHFSKAWPIEPQAGS
jgi:sulfur-oxidizing protein SoxY